MEKLTALQGGNQAIHAQHLSRLKALTFLIGNRPCATQNRKQDAPHSGQRPSKKAASEPDQTAKSLPTLQEEASDSKMLARQAL